MLSRNLKYYRLKNGLTKKELAEKAGVTPMAITYYESGERRPGMDIIKTLASVLDIRVSDFLSSRNESLSFVHGEFRNGSRLSESRQEYVREAVEEYMNRFFSAVEALGGEVLPPAVPCHSVRLSADVEADALEMRKFLMLASSGPISNLVRFLEDKGILVYYLDINDAAFSGMNGLVNDRPYIIINQNMSPERIRSTIAHELAHFIFEWPADMDEASAESLATAISGAFLFPEEDVIRELGVRRRAITEDMSIIAKDYGISMYLLVKRASLCHIINEGCAKSFYIAANKMGWKKNEPCRIPKELPELFSRLVFRAVCENEISIQKGAELLLQPYTYVEENCCVVEAF